MDIGTVHSQSELVSGLPCFVAADLGASSGRVIAAQNVNGRLRCCEIGRFPTSFAKDPQTGYLSWAIERIEERVRHGIERAGSQARICSVGVDSWGVDFILLDSELRRIGSAVCYRDSRTERMIDRVTAHLSGAELYRRTGIQFQSFNTLYQLAATVAKEPEWIAAARHFLMIPDYLHFRLSGVMVNEYTNATTTQMLNLHGGWDRDLMASAGLSWMWMQPPVDAGTVLGQMRIAGKVAKVVAPASHDTASAVVATPFEHRDEAFISSGTWSLMGIENQVPIVSKQAMEWNFSNEGGYGHRYRVLKNIMGSWLLQRLCQEFQIDVELALELAVTAKPWQSIVNANDRRFLNPRSMKEAIGDYCRGTGQVAPGSIGEYFLCAMQSLALSYRAVKEQIESLLGRELKRIRIVGGGSQNKILNQLCANCCRLPVDAGPVEASALGNICAQMIASGEISGLDEARAMIARSCPLAAYLPREEIPQDAWRRFVQYSEINTEEMVR